VYVLWGKENIAPPIEISGIVKVTDFRGIESEMDISAIMLGDSPLFVEVSK